MPYIKNVFIALLKVGLLWTSALAQQSERIAPAYPLLVHDPYFSVWSFTDVLTDGPTTHWTGKDQVLRGFIKVDSQTYRFLGNSPSTIPTAHQERVTINATQTIYYFNVGAIHLSVTFTSPLLLDDLELLSRPISYITCTVNTLDGSSHTIKLYLGVSTDLAVNQPSQTVNVKQYNRGTLAILKAGTLEQPVLQKKGDDLRIDWGYVYIATDVAQHPQQSITTKESKRNPFDGQEHANPNVQMEGKELEMGTVLSFRSVGSSSVSRTFLVGYDETYAIQYFHNNLMPWWHQDSTDNIEQELELGSSQYTSVMARCDAFNHKLHDQAVAAGGDKYARLCELAYRQSIAAHQLVKSPQGQVLWLSKENFSNGSISTVDVTYPSAPLYLIYNPQLVEGMLNGNFYFSESGKWVKPFAAHDLGTYPLANGQTYDEDMPVEESGNMIILTAAIGRAEGNVEYARTHWKTLTTWAQYLDTAGFDPANQLCTDDFAGHLAHNANLSLKAIVAIGCYAKLAEDLGDTVTSSYYRHRALEMARKWTSMDYDGDHYSLTFDRKGTWSQKYNLVWDKVLDLNLFSDSIYKKEVKYYLTKQNAFGLPLDSRRSYTKSDWIEWTATLASNQSDFTELSNPIYKFLITSPSRVPLSDFHNTETGMKEAFQARSVVGGYFMKLLYMSWHNR